MCTIIVPPMEKHVFDLMRKEVVAHLPVLQRYGAVDAATLKQKLRFVTLKSYNVERFPKHDIVMTFDSIKLINGVVPLDDMEYIDKDSMLTGNRKFVCEAHVTGAEGGLYPPVLRAMARLYGVKVPDGYKFRDRLAHLMN